MSNNSSYPAKRMRRLRAHDFIRHLVQENTLTINDLIYPVFIQESNNLQEEISSMPGQFRFNLDGLLKECETLIALKIPAIALFPAAIDKKLKTCDGREATNSEGLIPQAIVAIKKHFPQLGIISDIALDPYTSHGQDGVLDRNNKINNDETIKILIQQALIHAQAGADILAPSDMMDGRIGCIRKALEENNHHEIAIMAYSAKFASNYYGPFRNAVGSSTNLGQSDKKTYQLNFCNIKEALSEVALDIDEGADMIIVKPGAPYLDIVHAVTTNFRIPTFSYQVSGEYTMLKLAFDQNVLDQDKTIIETLTCFKRAGASGILTYFAKDAANLLMSI